MIDKRVTVGLHIRSDRGLRLRDEKTRRLLRRVRTALPWLEDSDMATARSWCQLEVLADQCHMVLRRDGVINPATGEVRRILQDFRLLRVAQLQYAIQLGMSPASRLAIKVSGTHAALDLAAQCAAIDGAEDVEAEVAAVANGATNGG